MSLTQDPSVTELFKEKYGATADTMDALLKLCSFGSDTPCLIKSGRGFREVGSFDAAIFPLVDSDLNVKGVCNLYMDEDGNSPAQIEAQGVPNPHGRRLKKIKEEEICLHVQTFSKERTILMTDMMEVAVKAINDGFDGSVIIVPEEFGREFSPGVMHEKGIFVFQDRSLFRAYLPAQLKKQATLPEDFLENGMSALKPYSDFMPKIFPGNLYQYESAVYDKKGVVLRVDPVQENFARLAKDNNICLRYNEMSRSPEIEFCDMSEAQEKELGYHSVDSFGSKMSDIVDIAIKDKFEKESIRGLTIREAMKDSFHPVRDWIEEIEWNGTSQFEALLKSLTVPEEEEELKRVLLRRWLVSAVAALYEPDGVKAEGTLVLFGNQAAGKTSWLASLSPDFAVHNVSKNDRNKSGVANSFKEGATLNPNDKDSVHQVLTKWLVELGEIDATFRRSDIAALKGFLTKSIDEYRRPYAHTEVRFPRRTVFCGSVNEKKYLNDTTGARRFWTLNTLAIDFRHGLDIQQLWAEVKTWYDNDEPWTLDAKEREMLEVNNMHYTGELSLEDLFFSTFYDESGKRKDVVPADPRRDGPLEETIDLTKKIARTALLKAMGAPQDNRAKNREMETIFDRIGVENGRSSTQRNLRSLPEYLPGSTPKAQAKVASEQAAKTAAEQNKMNQAQRPDPVVSNVGGFNSDHQALPGAIKPFTPPGYE